MNKESETFSEYVAKEKPRVWSLLANLGYTLNEEQPHMSGERFLMMGSRDIGGGGYKFVLIGRRLKDQKVCVIKVSNTSEGIAEIERERLARSTIRQLPFSYHVFEAPEEIDYGSSGGFTYSITTFIPQETSLLERPLHEQITLSIKALKIQESVHAATYEHAHIIRKTFGMYSAKDYEHTLKQYVEHMLELRPGDRDLHTLLNEVQDRVQKAKIRIEQYCGFLTHADFVPHNLRIHRDTIYLLDYASIHFGNKHESWARFMNFMTLYNPHLEQALLEYVEWNRAPEERESLEIMRLYKMCFLMLFHIQSARKTEGNLRMLTEARITFWREVLSALLRNLPLEEEIRITYIKTRDSLRSSEELARQQGLH